jgi:hypothetical protein
MLFSACTRFPVPVPFNTLLDACIALLPHARVLSVAHVLSNASSSGAALEGGTQGTCLIDSAQYTASA